MHPSKRKGDAAEREVQGILRDLLGIGARRKLGAGRRDDVGDIDGLPNTVIQVTDRADLAAAIRLKLPETVAQQNRAGARFGALFARRRGGQYVVCMTVEQFCTLWREAQPIAPGLMQQITPTFCRQTPCISAECDCRALVALEKDTAA